MNKSTAIINPAKTEIDTLLPEDVILICNPFLMRIIQKIEKLKDIKPSRLEFYQRYDFKFNDKSFAILGPAIGAPASVLMLEKATALGGKRFYTFGTCGALKKTVPIGSLILPNEAIIDEGTSKHYSPYLTSSFPAIKLLSSLESSLKKDNLEFSKGKIWTTDAPYRETVEKVQGYQDQLVLAVEMEISALFTVAKFREVSISALLVVSDELFSYKWNPGFSEKNYKESLFKTLSFLTDFIIINK